MAHTGYASASHHESPGAARLELEAGSIPVSATMFSWSYGYSPTFANHAQRASQNSSTKQAGQSAPRSWPRSRTRAPCCSANWRLVGGPYLAEQRRVSAGGLDQFEHRQLSSTHIEPRKIGASRSRCPSHLRDIVWFNEIGPRSLRI